jgi:cell wall-associated NlpC family hydrolase
VTGAGLSGIAAVQARVAQIESQFTTPAPAPGDGAASTTAAATTSPDFADALSRYTSGGLSALFGTGAGTGGLLANGPTNGPTNGPGSAAVAVAEKYLGIPYVYGGTDPAKGLDCSGLVQLVYRQMGINLPRTTYEQVKVGTPVDPANMQAGDLVFSVGDRAHVANGHVGIYAGNGMYVVAPHTGDVVKLAPVPKDITAVRRLVGTGAPTGGAR